MMNRHNKEDNLGEICAWNIKLGSFDVCLCAKYNGISFVEINNEFGISNGQFSRQPGKIVIKYFAAYFGMAQVRKTGI